MLTVCSLALDRHASPADARTPEYLGSDPASASAFGFRYLASPRLRHRAERLLARYRGEMRRDKRVDSVTEVPWPASEQRMRRQRWYFLLMGVCLTLIVLAWTWVRLWSVPVAVGMTAVAAVILPIAAFVGSNGVRGG